MRIVFVLPSLNLRTGGGSPLSFNLMATELCRRGYDVRALCLHVEDSEVPHDLPYRARGLDWRGGTRLSREWALCRLLEEYTDDTDIFHFFDSRFAPAGGLYRQRGGSVPVVTTLNNYFLFCSNTDRLDGTCQRRCGIAQRTLHSPYPLHRKVRAVPAWLFEQTFGFKDAAGIDRFLPVSPAVQQIYAEAGIDMSRSAIVTDVIDITRIGEQVRDEQLPSRPGPDGTFHVVFAGRLAGAKGADVLLDAVPHVRVPVHVHLVGDGPERDALAARARRLGVEERVTFHGWVPNEDLWKLLRRAHVFVHPCRYPEPCARSVLEALAIGVPAIVSRIGGLPWMVGPFARTFQPNDPGDLAEQLTRCCEGYETSIQAATDGMARARTFDVVNVTDKLTQVYSEVVGHLVAV